MKATTSTASGPAEEAATKPVKQVRYVAVTEDEWLQAVREHNQRQHDARIRRIQEERQLLQDALGTAF